MRAPVVEPGRSGKLPPNTMASSVGDRASPLSVEVRVEHIPLPAPSSVCLPLSSPAPPFSPSPSPATSLPCVCLSSPVIPGPCVNLSRGIVPPHAHTYTHTPLAPFPLPCCRDSAALLSPFSLRCWPLCLPSSPPPIASSPQYRYVSVDGPGVDTVVTGVRAWGVVDASSPSSSSSTLSWVRLSVLVQAVTWQHTKDLLTDLNPELGQVCLAFHSLFRVLVLE